MHHAKAWKCKHLWPKKVNGSTRISFIRMACAYVSVPAVNVSFTEHTFWNPSPNDSQNMMHSENWAPYLTEGCVQAERGCKLRCFTLAFCTKTAVLGRYYLRDKLWVAHELFASRDTEFKFQLRLLKWKCAWWSCFPKYKKITRRSVTIQQIGRRSERGTDAWNGKRL